MRRRVLWCLGLVLVALLPELLWHSPALAIRRVQVTGLSALTPEEARATVEACRLPRRTNWVRAPVREVEARLSALPWVARAGAYRRLPPALDVRLEPRRTDAIVAAGGARWEVDEAGIVIRAARGGLRVPEIVVQGALELREGVAIVEAPVLGALAAIRPRRGAPPLPVGKITVDQRGELCLNMNDSVAIRLGQAEGLPAKLALVRRIYNEEPDIARKVEVLDLRFPDSPACIPRAATKPSPREATMLPTYAHSVAGASAPAYPPTEAGPQGHRPF